MSIWAISLHMRLAAKPRFCHRAYMAKKREPIDDMLDAHVWMRKEEARLRRILTLDDVPDDLLAEYGLRRRGTVAPSYRCTHPQAVLVPVADITAPVRKLNPDALRSLLRGVRDGDDLPPVVVFREPGAATAHLLDGLHRYRVSAALGFASIPATRLVGRMRRRSIAIDASEVAPLP